MDKNLVLVVDDDKDIRDVIKIYLENEGLDVITASDGVEALDKLNNHNVNLIILDIMMPRLDGIKACLKIRQTDRLPIIMISAKNEDCDKILGLNVGADDYLTKPFNPLELVARVKSQLRRYINYNQENINSSNAVTIDGLYINTETREVSVDGKLVRLTPIEFSILELLSFNRGRVFSTQQIYQRVWDEPFQSADNTVAVHIRNIREKIEINPREPRYIKLVWGVGYKIDK